MMKRILKTILLLTLAQTGINAQQSLQQLYPVSYAQVRITDSFWLERMQRVATSTLKACVDYTENKTGRIRNFEKAAKRSGAHEGIYYDDSDVYKAIEAIAYSLKNIPNPTLEAKADEWIDKIVKAQLPDGYLNTYYTLTGLDKRWSDMEKHEDYCAGHLIEAGIAYYNSTGKQTLLDAGIRFANHIDSFFRKSNRHWVSGHQEIELALMRLYHQTEQRRYLELAEWFLEQRGRGYGKGVIWDQWKQPDYCQDGLPVKDQRNITGHAVRAMYMYTGAADVAAVTNDAGYVKAMHAIWDDVVGRNMYITGGIGAQGKNEGFGIDYDLPNETAYSETCASVGMVYWNQRMNMLTGDARYMDVLEKSLYNAALDGLSLSGDRFFYGNPLASTGNHQRREWFGTACCPSNIARLVSSLGNYIYSTSNNTVWVNLYIGSKVAIPMGKQAMDISLQTGFPWNGQSTVTINSAPAHAVDLRIRIPGWLKEPAPGGLYKYSDTTAKAIELKVNGKPVAFQTTQGYAVVQRKWKKGDLVEINTPMQVRRVLSRPELKQNTDRIALQYGPIMYCVEAADNQGEAWDFIVPEEAAFKVMYEPAMLGGINTINFMATQPSGSVNGQSIELKPKAIKAIPYFSWNNRGPGGMQIWLPTAFRQLRVNMDN